MLPGFRRLQHFVEPLRLRCLRSYSEEARRLANRMWARDFSAEVRGVERAQPGPMDQIGRGFDGATANGIAADNHPQAAALAFFKGEGKQVDPRGFLRRGRAATLRLRSLVDNRAALLGGDDSLTVELPGMADDAVHVFGMVLPRACTRAQLGYGTSIAIDDGAGRRVRAGITFVRHAIAVAVAVAQFPADDEAIGFNHRARDGEPAAVNVECTLRAVLLRRRGARVLPDVQEIFAAERQCGEALVLRFGTDGSDG